MLHIHQCMCLMLHNQQHVPDAAQPSVHQLHVPDAAPGNKLPSQICAETQLCQHAKNAAWLSKELTVTSTQQACSDALSSALTARL